MEQFILLIGFIYTAKNFAHSLDEKCLHKHHALLFQGLKDWIIFAGEKILKSFLEKFLKMVTKISAEHWPETTCLPSSEHQHWNLHYLT